MKKPNILIETAGALAAGAAGVWFYGFTGIYAYAESSTLRVALGVLTALWFVLNFRVGLNQQAEGQ